MADTFSEIVFIQQCVGINNGFIFKLPELANVGLYVFFRFCRDTFDFIDDVRTIFGFIADPKFTYQFQRSGRIVDFDSEAVSLFGMEV